MLIVLPPSETKAPGGHDAPISVSFPALDPIRTSLMHDLALLQVDEMMAQLKIPATKRAEAEENLTLAEAPVMPAIFRYTGVLFDALSAPTLPTPALERLAIGSALFGVVRAGDLIPRYRLSGSARLGGATLKARWGTAITDVLGDFPFVVDLRSGTYQKLGPVPGAATVRVESVRPDGSRKVVSHFNKQYKGELARALALHDTPATSPDDIAHIATEAGMTAEVHGTQVTLVV